MWPPQRGRPCFARSTVACLLSHTRHSTMCMATLRTRTIRLYRDAMRLSAGLPQHCFPDKARHNVRDMFRIGTVTAVDTAAWERQLEKGVSLIELCSNVSCHAPLIGRTARVVGEADLSVMAAVVACPEGLNLLSRKGVATASKDAA